MSTKQRTILPPPGSAFVQVQTPEGPELPKPGFIRSLTGNFHHDSRPKDDDSDRTKTTSTTPEVVLGAGMSVDKAMSYVLAHQKFSKAVLGLDVTGEEEDQSASFATLDNLEHFGISAGKSEALWRLEVERLVAGVNNADADILFPELGHPDGDYFLLSSLINEIWLLTNICSVDNDGLIKEKYPSMYEQKAFDCGREYLRRRVAPAEGKKARDTAESSNNSQHRLTKMERRVFIFALIDFVTLVLSRILIYAAPDQQVWGYTCLACVAKYAAKLKVISKDPVQFAGTSLDIAEDIALYSPKAQQPPAPSSAEAGPRTTAAQDIPTRLQLQYSDNTSSDQLQSLYYGLNVIVRAHLSRFVEFVLGGLRGQSYMAATRTTFEICSVVYETGLQRFRTWVYQERDGDLQATACQKTMPMARPAFQLLLSTARALEAKQKQRPPPAVPTTTAATRTDRPPSPKSGEGQGQKLKTHVHWNDISIDDFGSSDLSDDRHPGHSIELSSLAEAITIMVPLLSVSPFVLTDLPNLFHAFTLNGSKYGELEKPMLPAEVGRFKAFFSLFTDSQVGVNTRVAHQDASSLSKGLMTRDKLLLGPKATEIHGRSFPKGAPRGQADSAMETRTRVNREMDKWIFEENAVLVSCRVYVLTTMSLASFLAVGGVVAGFTVHGRIEAVDPFNITTYCWVLAAFCILVAKSVRVETWPWRDFLRGHVRCRSITELHSVTRIPEPFILCKLLDAEVTNILSTRGPYNAAFDRRSDSGFSIDRPLTMWTMLLSGLIMVKVSTSRGPSLVCLDVRRGTEYITVSHMDGSPVNITERLICTDLTRPNSLLPLKRQEIDWRSVAGLYSNRDARFV